MRDYAESHRKEMSDQDYEAMDSIGLLLIDMTYIEYYLTDRVLLVSTIPPVRKEAEQRKRDPLNNILYKSYR